MSDTFPTGDASEEILRDILNPNLSYLIPINLPSNPDDLLKDGTAASNVPQAAVIGHLNSIREKAAHACGSAPQGMAER